MSAILFYWPGAGRTELATARKIDSYLCMLQPGKKLLKGFKYDPKSPGIARHLSMLPAVATLLLDRTTVGIMKTLLHKHAVSADEVKVNLNLAEAFDQMEKENAELKLTAATNISMEAASAMAQAMRAKSFSEGGYFHELPIHEQMALVEVARTSVRELRKVDHLHWSSELKG